jgi:hypothetical protein
VEDHKLTSTHKKIAVGMLISIGLATFALSILRVQSFITSPFVRDDSFEIKTEEQLERERLDALKGQDTDEDGLSDYDELYVFRTSPFLDDTDSDGDADGKEVASGQDPNCPRGKTCRVARAAADPAQEPENPAGLLGDALGQVDLLADTFASDTATTGVVNVAPSSSGQATAAGSDAEAAAVTQVLTATFGDLSAATPASLSERVNKMSYEEMVQFLVAMGIPEQMLSGKNETTVRQVLAEAVVEALSITEDMADSGDDGGAADLPATP